MEHVVAGDRFRGRRRARHHPDEPPRRDAGPGQGLRDLPEPRGGRARADVPRSRARLRLLSLRPVEAALHPAGRTAAVSRRAPRSASRSASSATTRASSSRSSPARSRASTARRPEYGIGRYNDFNTFYYQAASGTSGGSSGSPVLDIRGRVLALNAGGSTGAASSFYLPLTRVVRALKLIEAGSRWRAARCRRSSATRPTTSCGASGCRRRSSRRRARPRRRAPACSSSPRSSRARTPTASSRSATCWSRSTARRCRTSRRSTRCSTTASARTVEVAVVRGGGTRKVKLTVQDLHAITPADYLEIGDGVLHTLSWQMARHMNVPISGVYVANPGYMLGVAGIPRGAVLTELDGKPLESLDDALAIFADPRPRPARDRALLHDGGHAHAAADLDPHRPRLVPGAALRARRCDRPLALHADRGGPGRAAAEARHDRSLRAPATSWWTNTRRRWCWSSSTCRTRFPA